MYAIYATNANWTITDIVSDLGKICTGAALNTLSASCNQALTSIVSSTAPAGWTMYDDTTGQANGGVVLTALERNGVTPKYLNIFGTTNNTLGFSASTAWNVSTNTPTNATGTSYSSTPLTLTQAQVFSIFCTREYIYINRGSQTSLISGEILRDSEFISNNITPLYPVHFVSNGASVSIAAGQQCSLPIMKNPIGAGTLVTTSAVLTWGTLTRMITNGSSQRGTPAARQYFNADGTTTYPVAPAFLGFAEAGGAFAFYGRMADSGGFSMLWAAQNLGADGDIMIVNGDSYVYFANPGMLFPVR